MVAVASRKDVLVIDSGGRGHAIGWKLHRSPEVGNVYHAKGNGGTSLNLPFDDVSSLLRFCSEDEHRGIVVVPGSEAYLADGYVDAFRENGIRIFGPDKSAARLESSKAFSKDFMSRNRIATSPYEVFDSPVKAMSYIRSLDYAVVVKADGLAAGKGVEVCNTTEEALSAIRKIMIDHEFGVAGRTVVVEKRLYGTELSYMIFTDGRTYRPLATSQDHKRLGENDTGPNTGGMGAYSPNPIVDAQLEERIQREIVDRTLNGMQREDIAANAVIYFGIMLTREDGQLVPNLLEINMRFGDPECQSILFRMKSDLFPYITSSMEGRLVEMPPIEWHSGSSVTVVLASRGYPSPTYAKGEPIRGIRDDYYGDAFLFHSGTRIGDEGQLLSAGGRVLSPTAMGNNLPEAMSAANSMANEIQYDSKVYRTDIGAQGIRMLLEHKRG